MDEVLDKAEELASHVREYINVRIDTVKLEVAEKGSRLVSKTIAYFLLILAIFFFIASLSTAAAFLIARWTGEVYAGFLAIAVIYLSLCILLWNTRNWIFRRPLLNSFLSQLFKKEDHEKY